MLSRRPLLLAAVCFAFLPLLAEEALPPGAAAVVNGEVIAQEELTGILMKRHGREVLGELVLQHLIRQESRRLGIEVAEPEILARVQVAREELKRMNGKDVVLEEALKSQGISVEEFRAQVVTRLTLEKLVVMDVLCGSWVKVRILAKGSEDKACEMLAKLKAGADFAALAKQESLHGSAVNGGDLGAAFKGELPPELEPFAFSAKPGDLSEVIQTPLGFLVARLDERQEAKPKSYAEVREEVARVLAKEIPGQEMLDHYLGRLRRAAKVQTRSEP